jgi:enoyl-CoA hydratase/carnithine racemase
MTEQVRPTDDSAVRIVRQNRPQRKTALTQAFSLLATARPFCAKAAKPAGLCTDAVDATQVEDAMQAAREIVVSPAGAVALSGTRLRGERNDVVVETIHFTERPQSDETSAAIAAFLSRKV